MTTPRKPRAPTGARAGRPRTHRSRALAGFASPREREVEEAKRVAEDVLTAEGVALVVDAVTEFIAEQRALQNRVGSTAEVADLKAIADDATALANRVDAGQAPGEVLQRLADRMRQLPPFAEPRLATMHGLDRMDDVLDRDDRIKGALAHWPSRTASIADDLRSLAKDCRNCPAPPRHTKPSAAVRRRLTDRLQAIVAAFAYEPPTAAGARELVTEILAAIGQKPPSE